MVDEAVSVW